MNLNIEALRSDRHVRPGFSLTELVVVIVIMSLLAMVAIPTFNSYRRKAKVATTEASLKALNQAIEEYHDDIGVYPDSLDDLIHPPADSEAARHWVEPFIKARGGRPPMDGYKHDFMYSKLPVGSKPPYEFYSWGPNGEGSPENEWLRPD